MSIGGGVRHAVARAERVGATALQIFTRNQLQWSAPELREADVARFKAAVNDSALRYICAHASYLINLASPDTVTRSRSEAALIEELERAERLGCHCLVLHPGSPKGDGRGVGIARLVESLDRVLAATAGCRARLALENTGGQGNVLGATVAELGEIISACAESVRLGVCLDTCHAFVAGYDLREASVVNALVDEVGGLIGIDRVCVLHLNDAEYEVGSRRDRHAHIGKGQIGDAGFRNVLLHPLLRSVPGVLETPKKEPELNEDRRNLRRLRRLDRAAQ
jgi:deoxyribonuclease-4